MEIDGNHGGLHTLVYASGPFVPIVHLSKVDPHLFRIQLIGDAGGFLSLVSLALLLLHQGQGSVVVPDAATRRFPVRDGVVRTEGSSGGDTPGDRFGGGPIRHPGEHLCPGILTDGMAEHLISSGQLNEQALDVAWTKITLRTFGRSAVIAEAVCFLASERASLISGQQLDVDGGYGG